MHNGQFSWLWVRVLSTKYKLLGQVSHGQLKRVEGGVRVGNSGVQTRITTGATKVPAEV